MILMRHCRNIDLILFIIGLRRDLTISHDQNRKRNENKLIIHLGEIVECVLSIVLFVFFLFIRFVSILPCDHQIEGNRLT